MKKIGVLYFNRSFFQDEANQTIGAPGVGPDMMQIFQNRRNVTNRLTDEGKKIKEEVIRKFKVLFDVDISLNWSIHAGCSMCPCSPGFVIRTSGEKIRYFGRLKDQKEINVWIEADGKIDIREPRWGWESCLILPEHVELSGLA